MDENIVIKNLTVSFPNKKSIITVLNNVSTSFERGKITAIIGESGCGKSILAMSILNLLPNNAIVKGDIFYNRNNLVNLDKYEINKIRGKKIALIPQNPSDALNPVIKIGRQIKEVLKEIKNKNFKVRLLLKSVGFFNPEIIIKKYPFELSGGMQQRVVSLFGIGAKPEWIIADEPTKGLDSILRNQIYEFFLKIKEDKSSMIIITHDISLAIKIADNIVVMYKGEIVEEGNSKKIYKEPKHKYTKILLNSLPSKGMKYEEYM